MRLGQASRNDQEQPKREIERSVPSEIEPLTNNEIPEIPEEVGAGKESDTVTKDEYSVY